MKKRTVTFLVFVSVFVGAAIPMALGAGLFPDVNPSDWFYDDVSAIAGAGISQGYADGTYRPNDGVTRAEMAAFEHRGGGSIAATNGASTSLNDVDGWVTLGSLTVDVPGVGTGVQYVHFNASVSAWINNTLATVAGGPGRIDVDLRVYEGSTGVGTLAIGFIASDKDGDSLSLDAVVPATAGTHTYDLKIRTEGADGVGDVQAWYSTFVATTYPFAMGPVATPLGSLATGSDGSTATE